MHRRTTQWQEVLTRLEAKLAQLQDQGVFHLNLAEAPGLAEELRSHFGARNSPALQKITATEAGHSTTGAVRSATGAVRSATGAVRSATGAVRSAGSRAAGLAASLRGGAPPEAPSPDSSTPEAAPAPEAPYPDSSTPKAVAPPETATVPEEIDSLESLSFHFRDCMACGLGATRHRLVFGVGDTQARLLFIGEAPGAEEDQQGLPFVGRAGALLTGLIQALGLTREDVYITNVVKCRPPGNRNPQPRETAACHPILMRQIELIDPALIVTLGNVPLKALKPHAAGITRERGKPFPFGKWQVLPTFHPSYLLRNPAGLRECWADFKQAFGLAYPRPAS